MKKTFLIIFLLSFVVYFFSWVFVNYLGVNTLSTQSEDTVPALFLPFAIIKDKTIYLDKYYDLMVLKYPHPDDKDYQKGLTPFYLRKVQKYEFEMDQWGDGHYRKVFHYVSAFPLVPALLALPVYFLPVAAGLPVSWENLALLGHLSTALIVSLSGGFFYLLLRKRFFLDEKKSILLTTLYLFATVNFALLSQGLWQHGAVELFLILALYSFFGAFNKLKSGKFPAGAIFMSSLFMGLTILSRPTAFLILPFLLLLLVEKISLQPKRLAGGAFYYLLGLMPPALFFLWYNAKYYVAIANQGYASQFLAGWLSRFPEGFLGMWLSPSKGILVYSPVFIFAFLGFWLVTRNSGWKKEENFKYIIFSAIIFMHTLIMGRWKHWYGGYSFGYRMASDVIPFMVLLLVPYLQSNLFAKTKKLFYSLFIFSVLVEISGLVFFDGIWHAAYDKGYANTSWLWSIKDSEFIFNLRRILVKLGLLERACPQCLPG